jgi:uncharacterized protein YxeA
MICLNVRKTRRAAAKTGIAVLVSVMLFSFCLAVRPVIPVNADSQIVLSAIAKQSNLGPGDLLTVSVVANRMPGIIEFGPVVLNYDKDEADYVSFEQGSELTNYVFTETQTAGSIVVSGTDQMVTVGSDGSGDEVSSASFSSESQVVLFSVSLRLSPQSSGEVNCWISDTGEFVSLDEQVSVSIGSGITLPVGRIGPSSDATIASLKIRGISITPEFNPNITDYSCSVERSVTDVQVSVTTSNLWAAVVIDGAQHLSMGDNKVTVDVTAQDGVNRMHYTIHVLRRESNIPDDASLVDFDGNTYTFIDIPEDVKVPEGFSQTTKYVNGYSVPAYAKEGVTSILLYLFDGNESPGFYFYNSYAKTIIKYEPDNTLIENSRILKMTEVPNDVVIPDEFKPSIIDTGSMILSGYGNKDGDFILYLSDENGNKDFYYYNRIDGSLSVYRFADKKAEVLYTYLFDVFLVIAIIEAVIITIALYIIRKMVSDRTNPRPKRV